MRLVKWVTPTKGVLIAAVALVLSLGCKKKEEDAATTPAESPIRTGATATKDSIPGEVEVRASLKSKDYSGAVNQLMALQGALATTEQKAEWGVLFQEVREALQDASPTDPKAAEAMNTLRALRQGR